MGRRSNCYTGKYIERPQMPSVSRHSADNPVPVDLSCLANSYFWTAFSTVYCHYMAVVTVCLVVLLSYMLPNISQKIHRTNELKSMKKVIDVMTNEVSRAEVACLATADQISSLQCSMHDGSTETTTIGQQDLAMCTSASMRATQSAPVQVEKKMGFFRRIFFPYKNTSNKEVTIMSYLYTDSFDGSNIHNKEQTPAEPCIKV